jgi:hypothetical protein
MKCPALNSFVAQIIFTGLLLGIHLSDAIAQEKNVVANPLRSITIEEHINYLASGKFKQIKKKKLKIHQPFTGYTHGVGYADKEGTQVFYYYTDSDWNPLTKGIKIWDMAFQIANDLGQYKFLESGFYNPTMQRPSLTYFLNVIVENQSNTYNVNLTFSESKGKLLYGLTMEPRTSHKKSTFPSKAILENEVVANTTGFPRN